MPLGIRDILLIMRAKDEASRTIIGVGRAFGSVGRESDKLAGRMLYTGSAIAGVGAGLTAIGAAGLSYFKGAADAAMDYRQQAALTLTQVDQQAQVAAHNYGKSMFEIVSSTDKGRISLKQIEDLGLRIANTIPVPLKELQPALFDIFSSMDVNLKQAGSLLTGFSKAAVAGQVDVQTAGRATIALMNAYKVPVEDVNKVLDFQFQLVRKGVGTYDEFASSIGRSIPSAIRAGQSYETLGGMLAFMTRNGLSAANASTSAARALDAMANPKIAERLQGMGINIRDVNGNFRPLVETLGEMNTKFGAMTAPDRAKALQELFAGAGGTIQARRFFDLVFKNFDEFKGRVDDMGNSAGALKKAYHIMFDQPQSQIQLLNNHFDVLKHKIGRELIPVVMQIVNWGLKLVKMFNQLSPGTRRLIVMFMLFASILAVVVGVVLLVVGALVAFIGLLMFVFPVGVGGAIAILGALIAIIIAIPLLAFGIIKNWKDVGPFFKNLAEDIKKYIEIAVQWIKDHLDDAKRAWINFRNDLIDIWDHIKSRVSATAKAAFDLIQQVWTDFLAWFNTHKEEFWNQIKETWAKIKQSVQTLWDPLREATEHVLNVVMDIVRVALAILKFLWNTFGDNILEHVRLVFNFIMETIRATLDIVVGIIRVVLAIINGDWGQAWDGIKQILKGVWEYIKAVIELAIGEIKNIINIGLDILKVIWNTAWDVVKYILATAWGTIKSIVSGAVDDVVGFITGIPGRIEHIGESIAGAITGPLKSAWNAIAGLINGFSFHVPGLSLPGVGEIIPDFTFNPPHVPTLARGIITKGPILALIGDNSGGREAVIPLNDAQRALALMDQAGLTMLAWQHRQPLQSRTPTIMVTYSINQSVTAHTDADPFVISRELAFMQKTNPYPMPTAEELKKQGYYD